MRILRALSTAALCSAIAFPPASAQTPAAPKTGWRAEFLSTYAELESKYVGLAMAMPWDKYSWRPANDAKVRSTCEVFMHIVGENYMLVEPLGAVTPKEIDFQTVEKCPAAKDKVVADIKASFAHTRNAVIKASDADADAMIKFFGQSITKRALLLSIAEHSGEHLGQLIAYARSNSIAPPWSK